MLQYTTYIFQLAKVVAICCDKLMHFAHWPDAHTNEKQFGI